MKFGTEYFSITAGPDNTFFFFFLPSPARTPLAPQNQRSLNKMPTACCVPMPASYAGSRRRPGGNNEAQPCGAWCLSYNHLHPLTTLQGLVSFFQARECYQKISEINPQLQAQVKGEAVPSAVLPLNSAFALCSGPEVPPIPSLHLASKPHQTLPVCPLSASLPSLFSHSDLCLPPFYTIVP